MTFTDLGILILRVILALILGVPTILVGLMGGIVIACAFVSAAFHTMLDKFLCSLRDSGNV